MHSFAHAFDGIVDAARVQPNFAVHLVIAALVLAAAVALRLVLWEFVVVLALVGLVLGLELTNTALEAYVDLASPQTHPLAKRAKDAAAGAVLVASAVAAGCGLAIFVEASRAPRPAFAVDAQSVLAAAGILVVLAVLARARWGT